VADIGQFVRNRIPEYRASNRDYLTVAVGCTGGQHRSVYIVDRLAAQFAADFEEVTARHSGLPGSKLFQPQPRAVSGESA
jgi:RNase adapter protein RapZ